MAEMSYQFTSDEDQEMETQPTYLSKDETENTSPCSSPGSQLPNNVPDKYGDIRYLIASQQDQMSASESLKLKYPPTPPISLTTDVDDNEVFTPLFSNPFPKLPFVSNCRHHPLQFCQQLTPVPESLESPTPKNCGQPLHHLLTLLQPSPQ